MMPDPALLAYCIVVAVVVSGLADYYFGRPADPPNEKENDR